MITIHQILFRHEVFRDSEITKAVLMKIKDCFNGIESTKFITFTGQALVPKAMIVKW